MQDVLLCIVLNIVHIIFILKDSLQTCDIQFGFKSNHSTVLCTAIYIETIDHYVNKGCNVYSCLLDASKAFARVHWGRLSRCT